MTDGGKEIRISIHKGICGYVAASCEVLNIPDAYKNELFDSSFDQITGYRTKQILTIPVLPTSLSSLPSNKAIAVLQVINKTNNKPFTKDDEDSIVSISMQLSATLEKTLLFEQSQADMKASKSQLHTAKSQLQILHQRLEEEEKQMKMSRRKSVKENNYLKLQRM